MKFHPLDDPVSIFFALAIAHSLADFPLQGSYLARQKARLTTDGLSERIVALSAHSLIHAGGVWIVTGSMFLGFIELILHGIIDLIKGNGKLTFITDQLLHFFCKIIYILILCYYQDIS